MIMIMIKSKIRRRQNTFSSQVCFSINDKVG